MDLGGRGVGRDRADLSVELSCGKRIGAIDEGLSDDASGRRWTESAHPGGICHFLYRTLYNKDNCRARLNKSARPALKSVARRIDWLTQL